MRRRRRSVLRGDVETTGVYPSDRVVEIPSVTVSLDGEVLDVFDTLVQPMRDVSASHIHGITGAMVADAPTFTDVAGDIAIRLHGACLVAHNVPFDRRMLVNEFARLGSGVEVVRAIDTLALSGERLADACARHHIPLVGARRSLHDATRPRSCSSHSPRPEPSAPRSRRRPRWRGPAACDAARTPLSSSCPNRRSSCTSRRA